MDTADIRAWLKGFLTEHLRSSAGAADPPIDLEQSFHDYGLDSQALLSLVDELSKRLKRKIPPTLIWEAPTIAAFTRALTELPAAAPASRAAASGANSQEPIAIIGMSCRFPGAPDIPAFWRLLAAGKEAVGATPQSRWSREVLAALPLTSGEHAALSRAGFLEHIDTFDAAFFGISPREASQMDPQQRLMLELCFEAIEDAGLDLGGLRGSATGVFSAAAWSDYAVLVDRAGAGAIGGHTVTGHHRSIIANRVSYLLDLHGPSFTVDSACSSGLLAVHLAVESLRRGESTLALAGGVNLNILPESTLGVARFGALSPSGRCYSFDARANGYARSEGAGVVVLAPLARAIAEGHRIYCLIRGSAVNNDGHKNGLTAPNPRAQREVLRAAYLCAGVAPDAVQYVEAHGTGTALGDPIEAHALHSILAQARPRALPLLIGSAKANVGHLEAAAGLVGLIKTALSIHHREIPPCINFEEANPHIPLAELGLEVPTMLRPWPAPAQRLIAGTSSFGFGGTNAHVVLEEWPAQPTARPAALQPSRRAAGVTLPVGGVVFVFPGLGAQWPGMARGLLQGQPVFRATIERCEDVVLPALGWSLLDVLTAGDRSALDRADVSVVAVIAVELALTALWRSFGVEPAAAVGHSAGEVAAAYAAGALCFADTLRIACAYSRMLRRFCGQGAMALVELPWAAAGEVPAVQQGRIFRAIEDSHATTVLGGPELAMKAAVETLRAAGIGCHWVQTDVAPHGPLVDAVRAELRHQLRPLRPLRTALPFISEVTGTELPGEALNADHFVRNFAEPVSFSKAIDTLIARGHNVFIDVGPHPITQAAVRTNLKKAAQPAVVLPSLSRGEYESASLLGTLSTLQSLGLVAARSQPEGEWPLLLSAKTPQALGDAAAKYASFLVRTESSLRDLAYTTSVRRSHHEHRLAVVGSSKEQLAESLSKYARGEAAGAIASAQVQPSRQGVVFVFSGYGAQWPGMGLRLFTEQPVFRDALLACDRALRQHAGFSILEELAKPTADSRLADIEVAQPILFAIQIALAALWSSWGVEPAAVIGHSMGEVAAAHVAGALTLEDAAAVICQRSRLLRKISGQGQMALIELPQAEAERVMGVYPPGRLEVAACNSPRATVIAGDPEALQAALGECERSGINHRRLQVSVAAHTGQVDALAEELRQVLTTLAPRPGIIPMRSTVTTERLRGDELTAAYWADNLRRPVRFSQVMAQWLAAGFTCFVEMGPHPILIGAMKECVQAEEKPGQVLAALRQGPAERQSMLLALAALHNLGYPVRWRNLYPEGGNIVELPTYPFQRERYWVDESAPGRPGPHRPAAAALEVHPLLGQDITSFLRPQEHLFEQALSPARHAFIWEHRVQGSVVFPAAAYIELALAAGATTYKTRSLVLTDLVFERMLALPESELRRMQVALLAADPERATLQIASCHGDRRVWTRHASGSISTAPATLASPPLEENPEALCGRFPHQITKEEHYRRLQAFGISCGPAFQGVRGIYWDEDEILGQVYLPDAVELDGYTLHPAWLDACLQVAISRLTVSARTHVPRAVARIQVHAQPGRQGWVRAKQRSEAHAESERTLCDLRIVDAAGRRLVDITGLMLSPLDAGLPPPSDPVADWLYEVTWRPAAPCPVLPLPVGAQWLVLADRSGLGAALGRALAEPGQRRIMVLPGEAFRQLADDCFELRPLHKEDYAQLLRSVFGAAAPCQGVVHLLSLDATSGREPTAAGLSADLAHATGSALYLAQALVEHGFAAPPRLFFVTRGAQAVTQSEPLALAQAPLWGFGRTLALEHPELRCTRVDLSPLAAEDRTCCRELLSELSSTQEEDQIAWRGGERLVARVVHAGPRPQDAARSAARRMVALRGDRTYLVTGGLGGLGLALAAWMVERGARHLLLVGRSAPGEAARQRIAALEGQGAQVVSVQADVADAAQVAALCAPLGGSLPQLGGVVHAAGILADRTLLAQSVETLQEVFAGKALGAWNLHACTQQQPVDFFVMYSSAASLLGSAGQANYAAANAFIDALSQERARLGLPALGIQWGPFAEVGLAAARRDRGQRLADRGLASLAPAEAAAVIEHLLGRSGSLFGAVRLDLQKWLEFYPQAARLPFFESLRASAPKPRPQRAVEHLRALPAVSQLPALVQYLREQVGAVAQHDPARIDPESQLASLGIDSLLSLELRSRLEEGLGVRISAPVLFAHASVAALARYLLAAGFIAAPGGEAAPPGDLPSRDAIGKSGRAHAGGKAASGVAAPPAPAPLAAGQQRLWYLARLTPGSTVYNVHFGLRMRGPLDTAALRTALRALLHRHTLLRAVFHELDGRPHVAATASAPLEMTLIDLHNGARAEPSEDPQREVERLAAAQVAAPFDLARGPLLRATLVRTAAADHELLFTLHHIVTDGWSVQLLLKELAELYVRVRAGQSPTLEALPADALDYARWQEESLRSGAWSGELSWWQHALAELPRLELPLTPTLSRRPSESGGDHGFPLPAELVVELEALGHRESATLFEVLFTAWSMLLSRYCQQHDFGIGTIAAARERPELRHVVGFVANTLVLRCDLRDDPGFQEALRRAKRFIREAFQRQEVPFEQVVSAVGGARPHDLSPLFRAAFVFQNLPWPAMNVPGMQWSPVLRRVDIGTPGTAKFELGLTIASAGHSLSAMIEYSTELFAHDAIVRMAQHFQVLLQAVLADPQRPLSRLPILTEAERHEQLVTWNQTAVPYPSDRCIHELIIAQAQRTPDAIAISAEDGDMTYQQLEARTRTLASRLQSLGVEPNVRVGVFLERSSELASTLIAVLRAGGAYVPLEPSLPRTRLQTMCREASISVLITRRAHLDLLPETPAALCCLDDETPPLPLPGEWPQSAAGPDHLAYVIFTSGSTGVPKGVAMPHRGVVNRLHWMQREYRLEKAERVLQKTPFGFDVSVWEFFWPLQVGATLVVARPGVHREPRELIRTIERQQITTVHFVPSMLRAFVDVLRDGECASLKRVLCSGEALSRNLADRFLERHDAELHNLYGPTEAAIDVTAGRVHKDEKPITIGRPIDNVQTYVLDAALQLLPVGVPGELYIAGVALASGYINRPELTAERFVVNVYGPAGSRMYRTGDLVRQQPDGTIEYLGRVDRQVKLRGNRIELAEIESALAGHPQVLAQAVLLLGRPGEEPYLAGFIVAHPEGAPSASALRGYLQERLPEYMIPSSLVFLPELPLTASGKLDRGRLAASLERAGNPEGELRAPRSLREQAIRRAYQRVLLRDAVGIDADFFVLGGDSLKVVQLVRELAREEVMVSVREAHDNASPQKLARYLAQREGERVNRPVPVALLWVPAACREAVAQQVAEVEDLYPLSAMQRLMLEQHLQAPATDGVYHLQLGVELADPQFSIEALERALHLIVESEPVLRTGIWRQDATLLQTVRRTVPIEVEVLELHSLPAAQAEDAVESWHRADRERGFRFADPAAALFRMVVFRLPREVIQITFSITHLLLDGWSNGEFWNRLLDLYAQLRDHPQAAATPALRANVFKEAVALELELLQEESAARFWRDEVAAMPPARVLPVAGEPRGWVSREYALDPTLTAALRRESTDLEVSLQAALLSCFLDAAAQLADGDGLPLGLVTNGRSERLSDPLHALGLFWNIVPFHCPRSEDKAAQAQRVYRQIRAIQPWSRYPLTRMGVAASLQASFCFVRFHNQRGGSTETVLRRYHHDVFHFPLNILVAASPSVGDAADEEGMRMRITADRRYHGVADPDRVMAVYLSMLGRLIKA